MFFAFLMTAVSLASVWPLPAAANIAALIAALFACAFLWLARHQWTYRRLHAQP